MRQPKGGKTETQWLVAGIASVALGVLPFFAFYLLMFGTGARLVPGTAESRFFTFIYEIYLP